MQYHGKMSLYSRDKAISSFAEDSKSKIMLASLRCGGRK
jgi:SNF2 family DNA or RNA helicase